MGGIKWNPGRDDKEAAAAYRRLLAAWVAEGVGRIQFESAIETALEEAEQYADFKAARLAAAKRVKVEIDFNLYCVHTGRTS